MKNTRLFLSSCLALLIGSAVQAQKKPLDIQAYKNWPLVKNAILSPDKEHLVYQLTDSTAIVYSIKSRHADTITIPVWKRHMVLGFDAQGKRLEFKSLALRAKPERPKGPGVAVDIWSWKDSVLQSAQLYRLSAPDSFVAVNRYAFDTKTIASPDSIVFSRQLLKKTDAPAVKLKRSFAKRLTRHFAVTDSIRIVGQVDRRTFIIERSSMTAPANLILTSKFKKYEPLTDVNPQKNYNWYTADVIDLHAAEGAPNKGILYKPEDFDSTKKYPVILCLTDNKPLFTEDQYYRYPLQRMDTMNMPYLCNDRLIAERGTGLYSPVLSNGAFNIPYFVSNGYVVLELPSTIETGRPGPAMFDRVIGAVLTMRGYNWVDTAHFGIQGQGTSAYFVNYIVTQTPLFKAAESSAGQNDLISHYGSIDGKGESMQPYYDTPKGFFAKTLWEDSAAYIHQSPVIHADDIVTPLLMMHNKEDMITPFAQGVELFTGMRRLGNRCWMLQYDDESHTLTKPVNQEDFTHRMHQFFNHYLKEEGAPIWMTRGIAAKDKGRITGFEIDTEIPTPPIGSLLNDEEYRKRFGSRPRDKSVFDLAGNND